MRGTPPPARPRQAAPAATPQGSADLSAGRPAERAAELRADRAGDLPFDLPIVLPIVLPELRVLPTPMQIFMFSAVTWNRHLIHYNADAARAEGHPDVVAQRSLIGNYFARHAGAWLGPAGRVARLSWRVTGSAIPNQGLCCHGVVRERLDGLFKPADLAPASVPLKYQGWLTAEDGRELAAAEGVLCIHVSS
jgi:hypothetical protein